VTTNDRATAKSPLGRSLADRKEKPRPDLEVGSMKPMMLASSGRVPPVDTFDEEDVRDTDLENPRKLNTLLHPSRVIDENAAIPEGNVSNAKQEIAVDDR
jgi:hypothetical protein